MLCYFEGLTHEQAASRLRWPVGTVKTRLSRGRERLRSRLERPGAPLLLVLAGRPSRPGIPAEFPERLRPHDHPRGVPVRDERHPRRVASSDVIAIAREVMRSMLINKLKSTAVAMCGLFLLGFGALVAAQQATGKGRAIAPDAADRGEKARPPPCDLPGTTDYDPATVTHRPPAIRRPRR